ncbi:unnamed protein product [Diplocarpon coronariae]|nr:hypothetical protein JHW43_009601 [Diplocarpon mali]
MSSNGGVGWLQRASAKSGQTPYCSRGRRDPGRTGMASPGNMDFGAALKGSVGSGVWKHVGLESRCARLAGRSTSAVRLCEACGSARPTFEACVLLHRRVWITGPPSTIRATAISRAQTDPRHAQVLVLPSCLLADISSAMFEKRLGPARDHVKHGGNRQTIGLLRPETERKPRHRTSRPRCVGSRRREQARGGGKNAKEALMHPSRGIRLGMSRRTCTWHSTPRTNVVL